MAEIGTDEGEVGFFYVYLFDAGYACDSVRIENAAPNTIYSVGGINDDTTTAQTIYYGSYVAWLWIIGVNGKKHVG
jgi:hypothetical protein